MTACNNKEMEQEVEVLREKNQELMTEYLSQDSVMATFIESFNDISSNLAEIRKRESVIEVNAERGEMDVREKISEDIGVINDLMERNRQKIAELDQQLKNANGANWRIKKAMETLKAELTAQIEEKDMEIAGLKDELQKMHYTVDELSASLTQLQTDNQQKSEMLTEKEQIIAEQVAEINSGYYVTGTVKELVTKNVVTKEGGFLGIGQSTSLNNNLDPVEFNKVDIREIKYIPLNGKKPELVSTHPQDSYKFEVEENNEVSSLVILDPAKFWNSSRYLVVRVN